MRVKGDAVITLLQQISTGTIPGTPGCMVTLLRTWGKQPSTKGAEGRVARRKCQFCYLPGVGRSVPRLLLWERHEGSWGSRVGRWN